MGFIVKAFYLLLLCISSFEIKSSITQQDDRIEVIVGMGTRPPFLDTFGSSGAGPEILQAMNLSQNKFVFIAKEIPTKRRKQAFDELWVDIVMWDNPIWNWGNQQLSTSVPLIHSSDLFIAKNTNDFSATIFDELEKHSIAIVNGYQYNFLNFETDINKISKRFNVIQTRSEDAAIKLVYKNRAKVAIVSTTSINWFIKSNQLDKSTFVIAPFTDSNYARYFLVPSSAPITAEEIDEIILIAHNKGLLSPIYKRYGLAMPTFQP